MGNFLGTWNGKLVCDDFAGYKTGFEKGMTEIGFTAHARRKLFDLHVTNKSQLGIRLATQGVFAGRLLFFHLKRPRFGHVALEN